MAPLKCPRVNCTWTTQDAPPEVWNELLRGHNDEHREAFKDVANNQTNKGERMKQPTINSVCTPEEWSFFLCEWSDFKELSKLTEQDIPRILLQCCDTELRRNLHRYYGNLGIKKEDVVLAAIKQHAVQVENIAVSRDALLQMKQDRDQPVRGFMAEVWGKAKV